MAGTPAPADKPALTNEDRTWGMLCHLAAMVALLGVPFGRIVGPLAVWTMKRNGSAFVRDQGKQAINFQITMTLAFVVLWVWFFAMLLGMWADIAMEGRRQALAHLRAEGLGSLVGRLVLPISLFGLLVAVDGVLVVRAARKACSGKWYRYPLTIPFLR